MFINQEQLTKPSANRLVLVQSALIKLNTIQKLLRQDSWSRELLDRTNDYERYAKLGRRCLLWPATNGSGETTTADGYFQIVQSKHNWVHSIDVNAGGIQSVSTVIHQNGDGSTLVCWVSDLATSGRDEEIEQVVRGTSLAYDYITKRL